MVSSPSMKLLLLIIPFSLLKRLPSWTGSLLVHCCKPLLFLYLNPFQWVLIAYLTNPKALSRLSRPSTDQVVPNFYKAPSKISLPSPYTMKAYYHSWMNLVNHTLVMLLPSCGQKTSPHLPFVKMFFPSKGNPDGNLKWNLPSWYLPKLLSYIPIYTDTETCSFKI